MALPFKDAFADAFGCRPQDFAQEALQRCLYPHARVLWGLLQLSGGPPVLAAEAFMDMVADARHKGDLLDAVEEYHESVRPHSGFLARRFYLRVSVERLLALHHFVREVERQHMIKATIGKPSDVLLV